MTKSDNHNNSYLWSLILAAGDSSRLKSPKQFLRYQGRSLIAHAVNTAELVTPDRVLVVLGAHALRIQKLLQSQHPNACTITNSEWKKGMSSSLSIGLSSLPDCAKAALILVSDQPYVSIKSLNRLVQKWSQCPSHIAAAYYENRLGVPVILPRTFWSKAQTIEGDIGARKLIRDSIKPISAVPMQEASFDIDTKEDAENLKN